MIGTPALVTRRYCVQLRTADEFAGFVIGSALMAPSPADIHNTPDDARRDQRLDDHFRVIRTVTLSALSIALFGCCSHQALARSR